MKKLLFILLASVMVFVSCARNESDAAVSQIKKEFQLTFSDDFNSGMNAVDDVGISIVLVVDVSGSMSNSPSSLGQPKYIQAASALETVSLYLSDLARKQKDMKVNVAVLKFSNTVSTVLPLTVLNEEGIERLKKACISENFEPKGATAIGLALQKSSEILAQSGTIFNSMIIITDGENTIAPDPNKIIDAIYANRNNKTTENVMIRTSTQLMSFIGFDIDSDMFSSFHEKGARITSAGNQKELEDSLKSLLEADITKLEGL